LCLDVPCHWTLKSNIPKSSQALEPDVSTSVRGQEVEIQALRSSSPMNIYGQGVGDESICKGSIFKVFTSGAHGTSITNQFQQ
jgi:hypothetical protein